MKNKIEFISSSNNYILVYVNGWSIGRVKSDTELDTYKRVDEAQVEYEKLSEKEIAYIKESINIIEKQGFQVFRATKRKEMSKIS